MLTTSNPKPLTPYRWCGTRSPESHKDDCVVMTEPDGKEMTFTITAIRHETRTVYYSLPGVWANREWIEMDRDCIYTLIRKEW